MKTSMFEAIKKKLEDDKRPSGNGDILSVAHTGNTFVLRLLPYVKAPENTFFHYFQHGWNSRSTGQYVSAISRQTIQERDPIAEFRYKMWNTASKEEQEQFKKNGIRRSEKWLVNVYVVDDPVNSENNGTVKILRYGKQIQEIIEEAISGEDADEFGELVFDLSNDGVDLHLKVTDKGDFVNYSASRFKRGKKLNLDEDEIKEVLDQAHDLTEVLNIRSYDELQDMLDEHWHVNVDQDDDADDEDEEPVVVKKKEKKEEPKASSKNEETGEDFTIDDDEINAALADLDAD